MLLLPPLPKPLPKLCQEVPYPSHNPEGPVLVVLICSAVPISHLNLALKSQEIYLKLGGILPSVDKFHSEGTLMLGGILPLEDKFHSGGNPMLGGSLNLESITNHKDKMCLPYPIHGASLFKETRMPPPDKMFRLRNNPLMEKCQTHPITCKTHLVILCSHILLKTSQILCTLVKTNLT
jgi:hypothetical protein